MWETLKFYLNSSWVSSSLLGIACLLSFWQLLSLISILAKLRKSSWPSERNIRTTDYENLKPIPEAYPAIIAKASAVMMVMCVAVFAFGAVSLKQRGQCTATGDISHSDGMTVVNKHSPDCYKMLGDDGVEYDFCVNPTVKTDWAKDTYIEFADYEMRDGYADFTVPKARYKKWENKEAFYVSRRR